MSKEFEEVKLVISADIVYDPDDMDGGFHDEMLRDIGKVLKEYKMLYKNIKVELKGFICD